MSNTDDITNVIQPDFFGTTEPAVATITLFATAPGSSTPVPIGQGKSDASGCLEHHLRPGRWPTAATRSPPSPWTPSGQTISSTTTIVPNLVIDTVGPKVTEVVFNRLHGKIMVTFQDYGGPNNAGVGLNARRRSTPATTNSSRCTTPESGNTG